MEYRPSKPAHTPCTVQAAVPTFTEKHPDTSRGARDAGKQIFTGDNLRRHVFFEDSLCAAVTHVLRGGMNHLRGMSDVSTLTLRQLTPLRTRYTR